MAKSVWTRKEELVAFDHGKSAAATGLPRIATHKYISYNERAAFNDGWDTVRDIKAHRPKFKQPERPSLGFASHDWSPTLTSSR